MAVILVTPPTNWRGSFKLERAQRNYRVSFTVVTNAVTDGPNVVRQALGVPKIGEQYLPTPGDADPYAFVVSVDPAQRKEDPNTWDVEVEYSTLQRQPIDAANINPVLRPTEVSWSSQRREIPADRDWLGRPVLTSAAHYFASPVVVEDDMPLLTITRNELVYDEGFSILYRNAVNADPFLGLGARQVKVKSITAKTFTEGLITYWKVTRQFLFRAETHDRRVLDQDFRDIDELPFFNPVTLNPYTTPTLLNGRGKALTDATTTLTEAVDAVSTRFHIDDISNFPLDVELNDYTVQVEDEVCLVTDIEDLPGNEANLVVIRGYAGTTAAAHAAAAAVKMGPNYLRFRLSKELSFAPFLIF